MKTGNHRRTAFDHAGKLASGILSLDEETCSALAQLESKVFGVEMLTTNINLFVTPITEGIKLSPYCETAADVTIKGTPLALLKMITGGRIGIGDVEVNGNLELAQRFQSILKNMDIDWEEYLSRYVGDLLAHQTGTLVRGTGRFVKRLGGKVALDISEYLRYEKTWLPDKSEVEEFCQAVDTLRDDVERISERIARLRNDAR